MTTGQVRGIAVGSGLVGMALGGGAAWIGITAGLEKGGLHSIVGWVVGVTGGIVAGMSLLGTLSAVFAPTAEIERAIRERGMTATIPVPA
jgi:hypothetical protein